MSLPQSAIEKDSMPTSVVESPQQPSSQEVRVGADSGGSVPFEAATVEPPIDDASEEGALDGRRQRQSPQYEITAIVNAARQQSVEKKLREAFGQEAEIFCVEKLTTAESRADRFGEAEDMVNQAIGIVEDLQVEMQEWADSIPENLQYSDKASEVQQAVDDLQTVLDELQSVDFSSVEFPGMMG